MFLSLKWKLNITSVLCTYLKHRNTYTNILYFRLKALNIYALITHVSVIFRLLNGYILEKKNLIDNIAKDDMRHINSKSTNCNLIRK